MSFTHSRSISNCCRGAILVRKAHHVTWNKELTALILPVEQIKIIELKVPMQSKSYRSPVARQQTPTQFHASTEVNFESDPISQIGVNGESGQCIIIQQS